MLSSCGCICCRESLACVFVLVDASVPVQVRPGPAEQLRPCRRSRKLSPLAARACRLPELAAVLLQQEPDGLTQLLHSAAA